MKTIYLVSNAYHNSKWETVMLTADENAETTNAIEAKFSDGYIRACPRNTMARAYTPEDAVKYFVMLQNEEYDEVFRKAKKCMAAIERANSLVKVLEVKAVNKTIYCDGCELPAHLCEGHVGEKCSGNK